MFDKNLMKMPGMKGVMGMLVVLALLQAAAIAGQAYTLSAACAALWAGEELAGQVPRIAAFFACFAVHQLIVFGQETALDRFSTKAAAALRSELLTRVYNPETMLSDRVGTASVAVSATEGIDEIQTYMRIIPPKIVGMVAISLPLLAGVFALDVVSGVILLIMFPVIIFFMVLLGRQARARAERQYGSYRRLSARFLDTLRGMDVIETFGAGDIEGQAVYRFSEKLRHATVRTLSTATLSSAVLDLCATFGVAAVAIMLAFRLMDGSIALAPALFVLVLAPEYFTPIRAFASDFHASLDGKNALAAVLDMVDSGPVAGDEQQGALQGEHRAATNANAALVLENVSFTYRDAETPSLEGISFTVAPGEHVAVIGESGAGKSTLASLVAGLEKPTAGVVTCEGNSVSAGGAVRYIPQRPYIFRATLEDNVRFYVPGASRDDVMRACETVGLADLVEELPRGLDEMVGEGARGLSGGQAHRVALARILLDADAQVLVFDEPTAHLDIETELELKNAMLPVMEGRTVVFATHRMHWLADMDRVITLKEGKLVSDEPCAGRVLKDIEAASACALADVEDVAHTSANGRTQAMCDEGDVGVPDVRVTRNAEEAAPTEHEPSLRTISWLRTYLSHYKRHVAVALVLGFLASGFAALLMFASGYLISQTANPDVTLFSILLPVAFVQLFGLGKPVARYFERLVSHDWVLKITSDLRARLYAAVRERTGDPARAKATGEYLSLLDDDIAHLQNLYLRTAFPAAIAYLLCVGTGLFFGLFSPLFALVVLAALAVCTIALPALSLKATSALSLRSKARKRDEYAVLTDDVLGADDWVLSGRSGEALAQHEEAARLLGADEAAIRMRQRIFTLLVVLALGMAACFVTAWAALTFAGWLPAANFIAAFALGFLPLIETFSALPGALSSYTGYREGVVRLDEYVGELASDLAAEPADERAGAASDEAAVCVDAASDPAEPAIVLNDVTYRYPAGKRAVLDGFTLQVERGQRLAILGRSGSGKTTLADIVRGSLSACEGSVDVCGQRVEGRGSDLSHLVGYLSQTPYLFNRTLRENLTLGVLEASDEQLLDVLRNVGLGRKVDLLPNGLDTIVGETGVGFSGGEAHRVALARVLVADAPVIVVDEPFSALDPETESALLETLFQAAEGRTLVVITHHLAHIERFDRVVFVEDGVIRIDGAPGELARENERFQQLVAFDS